MSRGTMIEWVLFDAVGTLIEPIPSAVEVYHEIGREFGSSLDQSEIEHRFANAYQSVFPRRNRTDDASSNFATSETIERDRWLTVVELVFVDVDERLSDLFDALWRHFALTSSWNVYPDVAAVFAELKRCGFHLAIASNFDGRLRRIVESDAVLCSCDKLFVSSEIGFSKPSPEFFESISSTLGCPPSQLAMIGDDLENDVLAPRNAGWHACQIRRKAIESSPLSNDLSEDKKQAVESLPMKITVLTELLDWFH